MRNVNCVVLSASDVSSQNGPKIDFHQIINASFHAFFGDATAAGTVKLQVSNDINNDSYQPDTFTPTHWIDHPTATATVTTGSAVLLTVTNAAFRWVRVVWTETTPGSTTITVNMNADGV